MTSQSDQMNLTRVRQLSRQCSTEFTNGRITFVGTKGSDKHRITLTMAWHSSVSCFSRFAAVLTILTLIVNAVAFATPYWMLVEDALGTSYSGLWTVCIFEVCGDFLHHRMFLWFHIVQGTMCVSLLMQLVSLVLITLYVTTSITQKNKWRVLRVSLGTMTLSVTTSFTGVLVYGIMQGQRGYDTLAWSFWLACVACFFTILSVIPIVLEVRRTSREQSDQIPILPTIQGSKSISHPVLRHSPSVDSCVALRTEESLSDRQMKLTRPRSASQVRMRVNSVSQDCPQTPLPGELHIEEECGAVFDFDNECFAA